MRSLQIGRAQCAHVAIKTGERALRKMLQSRRGGFSVLRFTKRGRGTAAHVGGITFGLSQSAVDFHQVIQLCCVCLRSSRYTWRSVAAVVYYPNCIIALCLRGYNVSRCICHGAPRLVSPHLISPRARSVKWLNCFVHAITKLLTIYNQPGRILSRTLLTDQFYGRVRAVLFRAVCRCA